MKKILFVITRQGIGGAQTFLAQLTGHLDASAFDIHIASGKNFFEIRKLISETKPDTLFLMSSVAGGLGTLAARFTLHLPRGKAGATRLRVVYRIGGWAFNDPAPWWRPYTRYAEMILARWRDVIIVNNQHDYDQALRYGIKPREKLVLVHNGIDPFKLQLLPRTEAREKLGLDQDAFIAGTIASDYPAKGLKYLPSEVVVLGSLPEASRYLAAFDVYVSPSLKEGFSWAILEAMAAKLPVIATRVGAAPEMIEDGKSGFLIDPGNTQQIVEKINLLAGNERLRQQLGIEAHQTVLKKFDLHKMVSKIESLLLVP